RQEDCFLRAGFFTKAAKDASEHINFICGSILLFAIQFILALLSFCRNHGNGLCRARHSTKAARGASFSTVLITFQYMLSTPHSTQFALLLRIFYRSSLSKQVFDGNRNTPQNGRQVNAFPETHFLFDNYF